MGIAGNYKQEVNMNGQCKPMGGKHPGEMPKAKTGGGGGKSPKLQAGNQVGRNKSGHSQSSNKGGSY